MIAASLVVGLFVVFSCVVVPAVNCADDDISAFAVGLFVEYSCVVGPAVDFAGLAVAALMVGFLVICSCVVGTAMDFAAVVVAAVFVDSFLVLCSFVVEPGVDSPAVAEFVVSSANVVLSGVLEVAFRVVKDSVDRLACVVEILVEKLCVKIEEVVGFVLVDVNRTGLVTLQVVSKCLKVACIFNSLIFNAVSKLAVYAKMVESDVMEFNVFTADMALMIKASAS